MFGAELLDYWHWWVVAILLFILEVFSPAAFFVWIGLAAGIMGFVVLAMENLAWQTQAFIFAPLAVVCVAAGRTWFKRHPIETDEPALNRRGHALVGRVFEVDQAIIDGVGRVRVGDSTWKVKGPDTAKGERVRVIDVESTTLKVEKA